MKYTTVAIETGELPDGRRFITAHQTMERPEIMDFIERFPAYWEYAIDMDIWVSPTIQISRSPRLENFK